MAESEFLVLSEIVHLDVAVGLYPVRFEGERPDIGLSCASTEQCADKITIGASDCAMAIWYGGRE